MTKKTDSPQTTQIIASGFSGPIPHPGILEAYEQIQAGFADRIISMAESETRHRHEMERASLDADIEFNHKILSHNAREVRTGQFLGFMIGVIALVIGYMTISKGYQWAGTAIGSGGVIGLVTAFLYGRKTNSQNQKTDMSVEVLERKT